MSIATDLHDKHKGLATPDFYANAEDTDLAMNVVQDGPAQTIEWTFVDGSQLAVESLRTCAPVRVVGGEES